MAVYYRDMAADSGGRNKHMPDSMHPWGLMIRNKECDACPVIDIVESFASILVWSMARIAGVRKADTGCAA